MSNTASRSYDAPLRAPRLLAGVLISLCLHGMLILGYRLARPVTAEQTAPSSRMTVWLQPLVTPRAPAPQALASTARAPERHTSLKARPLQRASVPAASSAASLPAAATPARQSGEPLQAKGGDELITERVVEQGTAHFDVNAALKMARKQASAKDPARAALPVAQLDDHPLYPAETSSKLSRDIQQATRPDCRKGGSIFSPLIWLLDKKDSGCKF